MSQFVLIILVWQNGVAITSVPFTTKDACVIARDDMRKERAVKSADCYGTDKGWGPAGKVEG